MDDQSNTALERGSPEWRAEVLRVASECERLADAHESPHLRIAASMLRLEEWRTV
jgi:hypothetical protein